MAIPKKVKTQLHAPVFYRKSIEIIAWDPSLFKHVKHKNSKHSNQVLLSQSWQMGYFSSL
jgi:hypothetical protein